MKWAIDPAAEQAQRNQYRVSVPRRFWLYRMVTSKGVVYGLADGETPVCIGTKAECDARADYLVRGIGRRQRLSESKE